MTEYDSDGDSIFRIAAMANAVKSMLDSKSEQIKLIKIFAEMRYEKYNALIEAGFTESQALHIITNTGIME